MVQDDSRAIAKKRAEWERELTSLSDRIDKLRVRYDRYFMGLERTPPLRDHEALERDFRRSSLLKAQHTATRFKFQNLQARWVTYRQHWTRVLRLIEEGRFRRDKNNAPPGLPTAPPPTASKPTDPMRDLYAEWSQARNQMGLKEVAFEQFSKKLEATRQKHLQQLGAKDVHYSVKVKNGKIALTAKAVR